jgi:CO/xanthine dehydrogenase Mo-binding subunit
MSQFAAEALGVPRTLIDLFNSDTDLTPDSHIYGACRSTYWVGGAIAEAARALKQTLLRTAAEMLDAPPARLCVAEEGVVIAEGTQSVSFEALAAELERVGQPRKHTGTYDLEARYSREGRPRYLGHFSVGAAVAEVSVDLGIGLVRAEHIAVAQDVGRAINPIDVRGQIEGAVVMELGAALLEAYRAGETLDFKRYRIPRTGDVPPITVRVVEVPSKDGPLGAKGVGEAMMGHVRAAILNAIHDSTGVRVRTTPATPERVLAALEGR